LQKFVIALAGNLLNVVLFFKSPTFAEEREWRLLVRCDGTLRKKLKFRAGGGIIRPYLEIPISIAKSSLASITCGPSPHGALAKTAVRSLLEYHGLGEVAVLGSDVPVKLE
jgi:hypothetical protein